MPDLETGLTMSSMRWSGQGTEYFTDMCSRSQAPQSIQLKNSSPLLRCFVSFCLASPCDDACDRVDTVRSSGTGALWATRAKEHVLSLFSSLWQTPICGNRQRRIPHNSFRESPNSTLAKLPLITLVGARRDGFGRGRVSNHLHRSTIFVHGHNSPLST